MTATEIIGQVKELPMVPDTARKMLTMLNRADTHRDELIRMLRCDNVLTAKLLRVCNSAHTGLKNPVASIDQAVLLLGDNTIFRMVCAIGFGGSMGFTLPGYSAEANGLWGHSLSTGMGAEYLTEVEAYGEFQPSMAFTAGLLHDIGKLVLNQALSPKCRTEIRALMSMDNLSRVDAERLVLGASHAEIGACLLQKWALPEVIIEAVANHHSPIVQPAVQLSAVVYLANCAAHLCGPTPGGSDAFAIRPSPAMAQLLGMQLDRVEQIVTGVHGAMKAVGQFMSAA
ncbi:MAG TPA: HDOD domain-containing protein [Verrucomicrobiae bacterium]|jgi:putative nucleotidyltransferase with HDIG domain